MHKAAAAAEQHGKHKRNGAMVVDTVVYNVQLPKLLLPSPTT
jgi:hypothetical protein